MPLESKVLASVLRFYIKDLFERKSKEWDARALAKECAAAVRWRRLVLDAAPDGDDEATARRVERAIWDNALPLASLSDYALLQEACPEVCDVLSPADAPDFEAVWERVPRAYAGQRVPPKTAECVEACSWGVESDLRRVFAFALDECALRLETNMFQDAMRECLREKKLRGEDARIARMRAYETEFESMKKMHALRMIRLELLREISKV
jgi:hypothetical protein